MYQAALKVLRELVGCQVRCCASRAEDERCMAACRVVSFLGSGMQGSNKGSTAGSMEGCLRKEQQLRVVCAAANMLRAGGQVQHARGAAGGGRAAPSAGGEGFRPQRPHQGAGGCLAWQHGNQTWIAGGKRVQWACGQRRAAHRALVAAFCHSWHSVPLPALPNQGAGCALQASLPMPAAASVIACACCCTLDASACSCMLIAFACMSMQATELLVFLAGVKQAGLAGSTHAFVKPPKAQAAWKVVLGR